VLTQADWAEAYNYLVLRLREFDLSEIVLEVEAAATTRVIEEYHPTDPSRFSRADLSEQSETVSRARLPNEAWQAAVMVLHAHLIEAPRVAERAGELLHRDLTQIVFRPDAREQEMHASVSSFALSDFVIRGEGAERLPQEVETLLQLSGMHANARSDIS